MATEEHNAPEVRNLEQQSLKNGEPLAKSENSPTSELTDTALAGVASAWLDRYAFLGGCVIPQENGTYMFGHPAYDLSPVHQDNLALYAKIEEQHAGTDLSWLKYRKTVDQYMWEGAIRELDGLLDTAPGLLGAVKAIVEVEPARGMGRRTDEEAAR